MFVLTQFLFRLSFGMALAMVAVSPKQVSSGYFRNNLYVLLGMNCLAALVGWTAAASMGLPKWTPVVAALLSYLGAVLWLYEAARPGRVVLALLAACTLWGAVQVIPIRNASSPSARILDGLDPLTGGLLLGVTMAAMLLGHWYLNAPGMQLAPLKRLVVLMGIATLARGILAAVALAFVLQSGPLPSSSFVIFLGLRWLAGIFGTALLVVMTWKTLQIPNTQSATGILYVAVISTFLGELTAQLLSAELPFPV